MSKTLDVYLHSYLVGHLIQHDNGQLSFNYTEGWLANPKAIALSHSLPLLKERFKRNQCRAFFGGILPEAGNREIIARNLGISARNDFAMLEQIGGECAGAVTFVHTGTMLPEPNYKYRTLSQKELETILKELPHRPLLAGEDGVRLSLAGAQDKIAVHVNGDQVSIPLGNAPSTHILKPAIARYEGLVFNEALCMTLAATLGLPTAAVEIRSVGDIDYLLVKRYDRRMKQELKQLDRVHQEDFCQALGIVSEMKYQSEGGPSVKQCFDFIREISSTPVIDLQHLLNAVIFNFLIGNHDAHGKNFSLLHRHYDSDADGGAVRLAPFYDLVCTAHYPGLNKKMAMKLGGEYKSDLIYPRHFEKLADEIGFAKPLVRKRVQELAQAAMKALDKIGMDHPVAKEVAAFIKEHCQRVIEQFKE
jgi:serine/threonine-protein kinase HipA